MSLKNSNAVALERRMDLASFFCMIGRHGPAVALAVIAMVSVLAGFIIYRTVRGKRRKATTAAAADSDSKSPEPERDASVIRSGQEPSPEESHSSVQSTDVSDEGSSDMKEEADQFHSDLKIRHRRAAAATAAAAEKKPPPYSPPKSVIQIPDSQHTTSDDTDEMTVVQDSYKVAERFAEEASHNLQCDTYKEMEMEDAGECHQGATDDTIKEVIEEVHDKDRCLKEPELIIDESHEEEEKVFKAEDQEDENVTIDKDVSDEKTRQEEENFLCASSNQLCFEDTPCMSEIVNDDRLQDNKTALEANSVESNLEEPVIHIEDVPVICIGYGKHEEFEEENHHPDSIDYSNYSSNHFSPEKEKMNEGEEAEEEYVDQQFIPQQNETWSLTSEQEPNLPSSQQDECHYMIDKVIPPIRDSDWDDDSGLAGEVTEQGTDEDHVVAEFDAHPQHSDKQQVQTEQKDENGLLHNQEDGVLPTVADQAKEKMLSSDDNVSCFEECNSSSVVPGLTLHCLNEPVKADNLDDHLSGVNTDANTQISSTADFLDLSLDSQQPQNEVKDEEIAPSLDKDLDPTIIGPNLPSLKTEIQFDNETGAVAVLAEENIDLHVRPCYEDQQIDQMVNNEATDKTSVSASPDTVTCDAEIIIGPVMTVSHPHVLSCYKDQETAQTINEGFDKSSAVAGPDSIENVTASVMGEEMSCPHLPSICQDLKSDHVEINETFDKMRGISATDAVVCDNASISSPVMPEEISRPDMLSFSQDQHSDQMQNNDFSEFTISAAPVMTEDLNLPMYQTLLPSFKQSELRDNGKDSMLFPGVGEESGISSMTVSPDLQDAVNEFSMSTENMVLPVKDCDPHTQDTTEAQNSLFADDAAISVINKNTAGMVFGPYPSHLSQQPHREYTNGTKCESFAANEDMFGHEIEDSYYREMEQFLAQIAASTINLADELKKQTDMKAVVEVVEIEEKREGVSIAKKVETEAEKEKEEDHEKTEISIMEATMDNNEWITDSNYQALPWMNLSATSSAQDHTKNDQPPTEDRQHSSSLTDASCIDTDTPPSTEVKQTSTLSLVDENTENSKKVVAVQPMPQNVNVTFRIHYLTHSPYQTVAVTGNQQELGNWKEFILLERAKDGHWATVVSLPAESHVEWKFVVVDKGEVCRWEECGNRLLDTGYGDDLIVHKWWGFL